MPQKEFSFSGFKNAEQFYSIMLFLSIEHYRIEERSGNPCA